MKQWMEENPTAIKVIVYVGWVVLIILLIGYLRRLLKRKLSNITVRYKAQKGVEILGYIILIFVSLSYFTGNLADFTLSIGLVTAGITITLQELILSIAGSFYIFFVGVYKPGDRIEINGIKGDVMDIDSIYTTLMEIGQWVSSDNYSGRIVRISNAFVFRGPIYNYSQDFPFVWDELMIPIHYDSDVALAKSLFLEVGEQHLADYVSKSRKSWERVVEKYFIENAQVAPTLAITMTDNWMAFNLRYIVDYRLRRGTKHELHKAIKAAVQASGGKVKFASTTIEVLKVPELQVQNRAT